MSKRCKEYFCRESLPKDCIICLGITKKTYQKKILKIFDEIKEIKQREIPKSYFVKYKGKELLVIFQIYGSAFVLDILRILNEGGCKNVIAVGQCGTKRNIPLTSIIIPSKVKCMDGITNIANPKINFTYPSKTLLERIKQILKKERIPFYTGPTISVPCLQHKISFIEKESENRKYLAIECELSAFLYFAKEAGMNAAGILVVRDNPKITLHNHPKKRYLGRLNGVKIATMALGLLR